MKTRAQLTIEAKITSIIAKEEFDDLQDFFNDPLCVLRFYPEEDGAGEDQVFGIETAVKIGQAHPILTCIHHGDGVVCFACDPQQCLCLLRTYLAAASHRR